MTPGDRPKPSGWHGQRRSEPRPCGTAHHAPRATPANPTTEPRQLPIRPPFPPSDAIRPDRGGLRSGHCLSSATPDARPRGGRQTTRPRRNSTVPPALPHRAWATRNRRTGGTGPWMPSPKVHHARIKIVVAQSSLAVRLAWAANKAHICYGGVGKCCRHPPLTRTIPSSPKAEWRSECYGRTSMRTSL